MQIHSPKLAALCALLGLVLAGAPVVLAPVALADEQAGGDILICVREQTALGGYGPERCVSRVSLAAGFGPASSWIGDDRGPLQAAAVRRLSSSYARTEFAPPDLEKTARSKAFVAVWMLSYNIKELASTLPPSALSHQQYWTLLRLDGHNSIGLTALDPGIERNPTGLKAVGLRISLPY